MSRVIYSDMAASADQESLRAAHGVRLVSNTEEGTGVNSLPNGVYGFTYSPALPNAPLFAVRRYRSYETHRLSGGDTFLIGFTTPELAARLAAGEDAEITLQIQPDADGESTVLVTIPCDRIRQHRGYSAPNERGFTLTVG